MSAPPRSANRCDDHPDAALIQRADDVEETIRKRLEVYRVQTQPLMNYYRSRGRLAEVSGLGASDEVYERLRLALAAAVGGH